MRAGARKLASILWAYHRGWREPETWSDCHPWEEFQKLCEIWIKGWQQANGLSEGDPGFFPNCLKWWEAFPEIAQRYYKDLDLEDHRMKEIRFCAPEYGTTTFANLN